ncbi:MAG: toprim domain-containing protein [Anaerolineae bacterium]|nr:toprim domain-containing protein [Anaerolineae bacterium]
MNTYIVDLKNRIRIESIISETVDLQRYNGHGYTRGAKRGVGEHSLVVNLDTQRYYWNSNPDYGNGDVINWVMIRDRVDFKQALEILADKAGMASPTWTEEQRTEMKAVRLREDALSVAQRIFEKWLWQDEKALTYVRGRGWTDQTIRSITLSDDDEKVLARGAGLGFTGWGRKEEYEEMKSALTAATDLLSPAAVAILGMKDGVQAWCQKEGIEPKATWVANDRIPSMLGWGKKVGLIYPHFQNGKIIYLSRRHLEEKEGKLISSDEPKSYNLPKELLGKRQLFYGHRYALRSDELILVEGQADAITLSQWGYDAVAIAGTSWTDHAEEITRLRDRVKECQGALYLALDMDQAGQKTIQGKDGNWPIAELVGAECRIIEWEKKDANDLLQKYLHDGLDEEQQKDKVSDILMNARMLAMRAAEAARDMPGTLEDARKMKAMMRAFQIITQIETEKIALLLPAFVKATGMNVRAFNRTLKGAKGEEVGSKKDLLDTVEMLGGWVPEGDEDKERGWYLEYIYDPSTDEAAFAYRDPDGNKGKADHLDIGHYRYIPSPPDRIIRHGAVIFPSDLGELKSERELVAMVEAFLRQWILLESEVEYRLAAYYVMLTWLYDLFPAIPYFRARGKTDTGKSEVMLRVGHLCYRLIISTGISTTASYKNAIDHYRGTMFLDEMDISDKDDDRIVLLNVGAMKKQAMVWKLVEAIRPDGSRTHANEVMNVYGPKLLTMYGHFKDDATESRCITLEMVPHMPIELKRKNIPLELPPTFYVQAQVIRNYLLHWRLERWQRKDFQMGDELTDYSISTRLNQVTRPLKYIAKDDPAMLEDVERFVQLYSGQITFERSQKIDARVLDAVVAILYSQEYECYCLEGSLGAFGNAQYAFTRDIALVTNKFMDEINGQGNDYDRDSGKKRKDKMTTQKVGQICRKDLQLKSHRLGNGFVIILDTEKIKVMMTRYGLEMPKENIEDGGNTEDESPRVDG